MTATTLRRLIAASLILATVVDSAIAGADKPPAPESQVFLHVGSIRMLNPQPVPPRVQSVFIYVSEEPASSEAEKRQDGTSSAVIQKVK